MVRLNILDFTIINDDMELDTQNEEEQGVAVWIFITLMVNLMK